MHGLPLAAAIAVATVSTACLPARLPVLSRSLLPCWLTFGKFFTAKSPRSCPQMTVAESQQRPLVGVGVLIFQAGTNRCLVGRR